MLGRIAPFDFCWPLRIFIHLQADGFIMIGPGRGEGGRSKKQAEVESDKFLRELNSAPMRPEATVIARQPAEFNVIIFGRLAELWRKDYVENPTVRLATLTREEVPYAAGHPHSASNGKTPASRTWRTARQSSTDSSMNARAGT